jgi:hypothetical protein
VDDLFGTHRPARGFTLVSSAARAGEQHSPVAEPLLGSLHGLLLSAQG